MQVECAIFLPVEVHTPLHQFLNLLRGITHYLLHRLAVTDVVACNHRIFDVFLEIVEFQIRHTRHATLCIFGVGLLQSGLANDANFALLGTCNLQCIAHTSYTCTDNQKVVLINHNAYISLFAQKYVTSQQNQTKDE